MVRGGNGRGGGRVGVNRESWMWVWNPIRRLRFRTHVVLPTSYIVGEGEKFGCGMNSEWTEKQNPWVSYKTLWCECLGVCLQRVTEMAGVVLTLDPKPIPVSAPTPRLLSCTPNRTPNRIPNYILKCLLMCIPDRIPNCILNCLLMCILKCLLMCILKCILKCKLKGMQSIWHNLMTHHS